MKRIMAWMLTMIVALSASFTAFAAESNLDGENRQTDIGVYARYIENKQWNTVPVDENGQGTTVLPGGTEITVSGALKPGWQLVWTARRRTYCRCISISLTQAAI